MRGRGVLSVLLAALAACAGPTTPTDPPDDDPAPTPGTIRFVYVVPSDIESRHDAIADSIRGSVAFADDWLADRTGYRLRLDIARIPEIVLPQTAGALASQDIRAVIEAALDLPDGVVVHAHYDGPHDTQCGAAAWPPEVPGQVAAGYLRAKVGKPGHECDTVPFWGSFSSGPAFWWREAGLLHDLLHTACGLIPRGHAAEAPYEPFGHTADRHDLMYFPPPNYVTGQGWVPQHVLPEYLDLLADCRYTRPA